MHCMVTTQSTGINRNFIGTSLEKERYYLHTQSVVLNLLHSDHFLFFHLLTAHAFKISNKSI